MTQPIEPITYKRPPWTLTVAVLAKLLKRTRPTIYRALAEERLILTDDLIVYTPLPKGRPKKGPESDAG